MEKPDVTTNEIMEFLQEHMVMRGEFYVLRDQVQSLDGRVQSLEVKVNQVKLDLLDAMDDKLGSLKGDLVVMMRNEDKKVMLLVQKLKQKNIFDDRDVDEFLALQPFPQPVRLS